MKNLFRISVGVEVGLWVIVDLEFRLRVELIWNKLSNLYHEVLVLFRVQILCLIQRLREFQVDFVVKVWVQVDVTINIRVLIYVRFEFLVQVILSFMLQWKYVQVRDIV